MIFTPPHGILIHYKLAFSRSCDSFTNLVRTESCYSYCSPHCATLLSFKRHPAPIQVLLCSHSSAALFSFERCSVLIRALLCSHSSAALLIQAPLCSYSSAALLSFKHCSVVIQAPLCSHSNAILLSFMRHSAIFSPNIKMIGNLRF